MNKQSDTPLITVVTVVYNSVDLLKKTIESVTEQSFRSFEYIIIDGGSTDGSVELIKQHETSLSAWVSEKDNGIYNAMNKGVNLAKGKWICFVNSGDVFVDVNVLEKVADFMNTAPETDIFYGNIFVNAHNGELKECIASPPCNKHRMYFCHQSAFVKTILIKNNPFDEKYKMSADFKFFKQCYLEKRDFCNMNFPIVIYDTQGISNTSRKAGIKENIAVIKETDKGIEKIKFLLRLYFVIGLLKVRRKK